MMKGRPLVGPAGKIFAECLHQAGLIRAELSIANVCRDRISSVGDYVGQNGLTERGRAAAADLRERLKDHEANVFVPMGNLALAALTDEYGKGRGITRLRGSIYKSSLLPGKKVIPTIHPAAAMPYKGSHAYTQRYTIAHDFRKIRRHSEFPELRLPQRELFINPTYMDATEYLRDLLCDHRTFAFDIEITNFQVSCIAFSHTPSFAMCIPFTGDYWTESEECNIWNWIAQVLSNPRSRKIAHNAMFDVSFLLLQNKIRTVPPIDCTMIKHRILYPDFSAKLEFVCSNYTDEPYYKDDRKLWTRPWDDPDEFYRYNCKDAVVTREADDLLTDEIENDAGCEWTYHTTMSMFEPCLYMMTRGLELDLERLKVVRKEVAADLEAKEAELEAASEVPFNPSSPKQCMNYFYVLKGITPYMSRKTGKPTCDDKALARIVRKYNLPEARLCQEVRTLRTLRDRYLNLDYDADGRLRSFYDPRGTTTGRLSSSKTVFERGLNMQNLDPKFKYFIVPDTA
jgi:uracil-DNA glycosylase family 4